MTRCMKNVILSVLFFTAVAAAVFSGIRLFGTGTAAAGTDPRNDESFISGRPSPGFAEGGDRNGEQPPALPGATDEITDDRIVAGDDENNGVTGDERPSFPAAPADGDRAPMPDGNGSAGGARTLYVVLFVLSVTLASFCAAWALFGKMNLYSPFYGGKHPWNSQNISNDTN